MKKTRIASIETFRVASIIAVICLHTMPFKSLGLENIYFKFFSYLIDNFCRFAVPFFFIAFGYFFGRKLRLCRTTSESFGLLFANLKKYFIIFCGWLLIYTLIPGHIPFIKIIKCNFSYDYSSLFFNHLRDVFLNFQNAPIRFLLGGGPSVPLWFLLALMMALVIVFSMYMLKKEKYLFALALSLYFLGLLAGKYAGTPLGIHLPFKFSIRDGPFFSTLFVTLGFWLSGEKRVSLKTWQALLIIITGFVFQEIEALFLWKFYHVHPVFDYLAGTVPFGAGVFLLALSKPDIGKSTLLPKLAPLTLGIYVVHLLTVSYCSMISHFVPGFLWQILFPFIVFISSGVIVIILREIPVINLLVGGNYKSSLI